MQKIKIAQIGTFDVENFGDLLFPEVLKLKLGSGYDIDLFSYGEPPLWTWQSEAVVMYDLFYVLLDLAG